VGQPIITKKVTVSPQEVALIYEADSYIPPFYKGKGLFNQEGTVRFVALPNMTAANGTRLNPNNLIYKWIINDTVQGSMSGYGRNSFVYKSGILGGKVKVEVEVSSTDGKTKGRGLMISSPQDSEVLIYEKNPLFGILYNKELSYTDFRLQDKEITLKTEPFSLSTTNGSGLTYRWSINGGAIPVPENQNYVTLRNSTGQQGTSLINVLVNNPTHILQRTSKSIPINF
jgi:hypothetical protein